jgi:quinol monooxygenase YgiN
MIRNVVMVKLRPDADPGAVRAVQEGFAAMNCPGTVSYTLGDDLRLREGNWSFAIVADFEDEEAYRAYDADPEHNRLRAQLAGHVAEIARVQFELADR